MPGYEVESVANAHCENGENPFWDKERRLVYWSDIPRGRLFRLDVNSGEWEQFYADEPVGGFTLQADGSLLLFRVDEIAILQADGRIEVLTRDIDPEMKRFNDAIADPEGRVFAGTLVHDERQVCGLFRVDVDGNVTKLFSGTAISNGMGFSPNVSTLYWTDTTAKTIFAFDYNRASGELTSRRRVLTSEGEGEPDGLVVDAAGCLWSARYGGGAIFRYSPSGELLKKIELPVPKVTSLAFGGDDLCELYVTTAGGEENAQSLDGALFRVRVDVPGQKEFRSRVGLT